MSDLYWGLSEAQRPHGPHSGHLLFITFLNIKTPAVLITICTSHTDVAEGLSLPICNGLFFVIWYLIGHF